MQNARNTLAGRKTPSIRQTVVVGYNNIIMCSFRFRFFPYNILYKAGIANVVE